MSLQMLCEALGNMNEKIKVTFKLRNAIGEESMTRRFSIYILFNTEKTTVATNSGVVVTLQ